MDARDLNSGLHACSENSILPTERLPSLFSLPSPLFWPDSIRSCWLVLGNQLGQNWKPARGPEMYWHKVVGKKRLPECTPHLVLCVATEDPGSVLKVDQVGKEKLLSRFGAHL